MLRRLLRAPRTDVEVGVAIPIGCMVPLAIAVAVIAFGAAVVRMGSNTTKRDR